MKQGQSIRNIIRATSWMRIVFIFSGSVKSFETNRQPINGTNDELKVKFEPVLDTFLKELGNTTDQDAIFVDYGGNETIELRENVTKQQYIDEFSASLEQPEPSINRCWIIIEEASSTAEETGGNIHVHRCW